MTFSHRVSLLMVALCVFAQPASAHRAWIKPTTTVVSGEDEWVSFDAAIANGIFMPDHFAMPIEGLVVTSPSGKSVEKQHQQALRYRSVFDINLTEQGTYKVESASQTLMAFWQDKDGKRQMWPGRGKTGTLDEFKTSVPTDAEGLEVIHSARRINVFVTAGAPTQDALKPSGQGLELDGKTHPNDLYTGEPVSLGFLMDGKPASGAKVVIVKDGEKYRDTNDDIQLTTDKQGQVKTTFAEPGMYWLEAEFEDNQAKAPAQKRRGMFVLVMEVLPQ